MYILKMWLFYTLVKELGMFLFDKEICYTRRLGEIGKKKKMNVSAFSFFEQKVIPCLNQLIETVAKLFHFRQDENEELQNKLSLLNIDMTTERYRSLVFLVSLSCSVILKVFVNVEFSKILLSFFAVMLIQHVLLDCKVKKQQAIMKEELPNVLDLLSVSVRAGLSFSQSLSYITEKMDGPLIEVLREMQTEISMGLAKDVAMKKASRKTGLEDLQMFFSAVLQGETLGISLQEVLDNQSQVIRKKHRQNMEEKAAKIPVKILFPLVFFIFPVLFIVLLGPAIPDVKEALGGL